MLEPKSKKGSCRSRDPFLVFWFRYVHRNASFLEVGAADRVAARVMDDLPNYLGLAAMLRFDIMGKAGL